MGAIDGEAPAADVLAARGPVGMPPLGPVGVAVGEAEAGVAPGACRAGMAGQPPLPPRAANPPRAGAT